MPGQSVEAGKNQNFLRERQIKKIVETYREFAPVEKFASVVEIDAICANDFNLNISRYVDIAEEEEQLDVAVELRKLRVAEKARAEAEAKMNHLSAELGSMCRLTRRSPNEQRRDHSLQY